LLPPRPAPAQAPSALVQLPLMAARLRSGNPQASANTSPTINEAVAPLMALSVVR